MTREAVAYWKPAPAEEKPVSALMETPRGITPIEGLEVVELDELPPGHEALALAELARLVINALSASPKAYQDSELLKEALRYALDRTVEAFMLERERITKAQIQLSANDTFTPQLEEKADEAVDRARAPRRLTRLGSRPLAPCWRAAGEISDRRCREAAPCSMVNALELVGCDSNGPCS